MTEILGKWEEFLRNPWRYRSFTMGGHPQRRTTTLKRGLISHWKLDEESGTRKDSFGENDLLIDTDPVPSDSGGKFGGLCAKFQDDPNLWLQLSLSGISPAIDTSNGFTISAWIKANQCDFYSEAFPVIDSMFVGNPAEGPVMQIGAKSADAMRIFSESYVVGVTRTGNWSALVAYAVNDIATRTANGVDYVCIQENTNKDPMSNPDYWKVYDHFEFMPQVDVAINIWHFVTVIWDKTHGVLQVNGGDPIIGDPFNNDTGQMATTINLLMLGTNNGVNETDTVWWNAVSLWNRVLTANERALLYNNGNGLPFEQW